MKVKLIQQYTLGDVLFLQKAIDIILSLGHEVYLPTDYPWLSEYIKKDGLCFCDSNVDKVINFHNVIEPNHPYDLMTYKYQIIKQAFDLEDSEKTSWVNWQQHMKFNRNIQKENEIYYNILNLKDGEEYILKNHNLSKGERREFKVESNLKTVEINIIPGYSMFDWSKVIENAKEIWTIDTAINYLIESIDTKSERFVVFARHSDTKKALSHIWNKNWEWR
jgi:hypothetical protein